MVSTVESKRGQRSWRQRLLVNMGTAAVIAYLRFVHRTSRMTIHGEEHDTWPDTTRRVLYAGFHQSILFATVHLRDRRVVVMISRSRDGDLGARIVHRFGLESVRGSSSRGGSEALEEMRQRLEQEPMWGAMVCDGPRGPYGIPKPGVLLLARETGLPIVPVAWWAGWKIMGGGWDRTLLPLPFSRIHFAFGKPLRVPPGASREECEGLRRVLSDRVAALLFRCQEACGETRRDFRPREWLQETRASGEEPGSPRDPVA